MSPPPAKKKTSTLDSTHPVFVPHHPALFYPHDKFFEFVLSELDVIENTSHADDRKEISAAARAPSKIDGESAYDIVSSIGELTVMTGTESTATGDSFSIVGYPQDDAVRFSASDREDTRGSVDTNTPTGKSTSPADPKLASPFVSALLSTVTTTKTTSPSGLAPSNMTLTTNAMPSHISTLIPTLDLYNDLQGRVSSAHLNDLLTQAWQQDPLETLKVIFHARSIHLGKGERESFYRAIAWLVNSGGKRGKATVLANLGWVVDRTITKKKEKKEKEGEGKEGEGKEGEGKEGEVKEGEEKDKDGEKNEGEEKEEEIDEDDPVYSHGYWKDLSNILVLDARSSLNIFAPIHEALNPPKQSKRQHFNSRDPSPLGEPIIPPPTSIRKPGESKPNLTEKEKEALAKEKRHQVEKTRHEHFLRTWNERPFYHLLHLSTARAFAVQLQSDLDALNSGDKGRMRKITFAAKWAPSLEGFHDKYSFLASSIAEYLFPPEHPLVASHFSSGGDREGYLKLAREHYRRLYLSPLRKHLAIVERDITEETFDKINYSRVPALAMSRYKTLFMKKDLNHFLTFLRKVAEGKATVTGGVLTPASLVKRAMELGIQPHRMSMEEFTGERQLLNGQWESLVRTVKESGKLENAISVVDVSGSMTYPTLPDGTNPMQAAIGLGLLLSEVAEEPFRHLLITFTESPSFTRVDGRDIDSGEEVRQSDLCDKVAYIQALPWGMNTNFLAVFEDLLLPLAIKYNLTQDQMVKKIFVFSDMGFDSAQVSSSPWETGHERLQRLYVEKGYVLPEMVYWNLAEGGGKSGKPVTGEKEGCILLSGGGAGTLKAFVEGGLGVDEEEGEEMEEGEEEEEEESGKRKREEGEGDDMNVDDKAVEAKEEKKKKRKLDPLQAMRKMLSHKAYEGLKIVG